MNITWLSEIDSTNMEAARHLSGAPEGSVWAALYQTAGRGQQSNSWESESGKNVLFSLLLRPVWLPADKQFYISKIVSLGIHDFLAKQGIASSIKWPNDGYVGDKKIAGILIENHIAGNTLSASIAGVGLNVNQQEFLSGAPNPTSLLLESGCKTAIRKALQDATSCILARYEMLGNGHTKQLDADYLQHLYRFGEWHWFETQRKRFRAKITGVRPSGELMLQNEEGKTALFAFKEVRFLM